LNGNIQAAKTFVKRFIAGLPRTIKLEPDSLVSVGEHDEVVMTKDSLVNFSQMAVLTCQRSQGDKNKVMRESWVRLSGTYQGKVGLLATPEIRKVCTHSILICYLTHADALFLEVPERNRCTLLRHSTSSESGGESLRRHDVVAIRWPSTNVTKKSTRTCLAIRSRVGLALDGDSCISQRIIIIFQVASLFKYQCIRCTWV
jgi:hypothetical protein